MGPLSIVTIGQWIELPTSGGAADRFRADQPGGSGLLQIASSNATLACRENGLRHLWEDYGSADVYADLPAAGVAAFEWASEDAGAWSRFCGVHRVRLYGEQAVLPRLHLALRALAPSPYTLGVVLAVSRGTLAPDMAPGTYGTVTTTSTSATDLSVTFDLRREMLAPRAVSLAGASGVEEAGELAEVGVWVGAWCTSGSGVAKGALYGPTVFLREPS